MSPRVATIEPGGEWWRGFTAAPRAELLAVGGFDEAFDGDKSEEDPDLGLRMSRRFGNRLVVDRRFWVVEHAMVSYAYDPRAVRASVGKCNHALLLSSGKLKRADAGSGRRPASEVDSLAEWVCPGCHAHAACASTRLGARARVQDPTSEEVEAYARWRAAYVEEGA